MEVYLIACLRLNIGVFSEIVDSVCIMVDFIGGVACITNIFFPRVCEAVSETY
jgi:hypothetical protein